MSRIAYVNGRYVPLNHAQVGIEDRGFQFADGVYEVCEVRGGHLVDETRHMARLDRSLNELRIARPMSVPPRSETVLRLRLTVEGEIAGTDLADEFDRTMAQRLLEADEFYGDQIPESATTRATFL